MHLSCRCQGPPRGGAPGGRDASRTRPYAGSKFSRSCPSAPQPVAGELRDAAARPHLCAALRMRRRGSGTMRKAGVAVVVYGLANCDVTRRARRWLDARGVTHSFHDFHARGLPQETLARWVGELGWEVLLNKRGTTFRALPDADKQALNQAKATALMLNHHTLVK